ncbi:alanine racemase [Crocinitomicaceae bacterium]|nr:alanine racemase [Crocinitomicaceae bacterium]
MKLRFSISELKSFTKIIHSELIPNLTSAFESIVVDSRKITSTNQVAFCAILGRFHDGHDFMEDAYRKGIRLFIVNEKHNYTFQEDATYFLVQDTLWTLQELAKLHRQKFDFPIVLIAGDLGKTTTKEWAYHLLSSKYRVIRSPKSFNTNMGVALSLLELNENCDLALIEVAEQSNEELIRINEIVEPNIGIVTALKNKEFNPSLLNLYKGCSSIIIHPRSFAIEQFKSSFSISNNILSDEVLTQIEQEKDKTKEFNLLLAIQLSQYFKLETELLLEQLKSIPKLALRMETFEGINGNTVINDSYNLDFEALIYSLEYQLTVSGNKKRIIIIGIDSENIDKKDKINAILDRYKLDEVIYNNEEFDYKHIQNAVVLIKGTRNANMQKIAQKFRLKTHKTFLEIDLKAIKHNLEIYKSNLLPSTKVLVMVKSNAYGGGAEEMAKFYEEIGIDYLGVAYVDEGVDLRNKGIQLPILVMNAEENGFDDCIAYELEPSIYSFEQLDEFIKALINVGKTSYPIHLKINTGMNRLGFELSEIGKVIETIKAQPEIKIKSIFSHLADADNIESSDFTKYQIQQFEQAVDQICSQINYPIEKHLLNSEASAEYKDYQFDMVRLGIGVYGFASHPVIKKQLVPAIKWKSSISQIKKINPGESVGYSRSFIATKNMTIAIVPVGYADGYRRSLSNGLGGVYIKEVFCPVVGKVCMDMIMVDITDQDCKVGDTVEIIGENQSMEDFSKKMDTIPYEVMTNFSKRVHRIYLTN